MYLSACEFTWRINTTDSQTNAYVWLHGQNISAWNGEYIWGSCFVHFPLIMIKLLIFLYPEKKQSLNGELIEALIISTIHSLRSWVNKSYYIWHCIIVNINFKIPDILRCFLEIIFSHQGIFKILVCRKAVTAEAIKLQVFAWTHTYLVILNGVVMPSFILRMLILPKHIVLLLYNIHNRGGAKFIRETRIPHAVIGPCCYKKVYLHQHILKLDIVVKIKTRFFKILFK